MQPLSLSFFEEDAKGAAALTAVPRVHLVLADLEAVAHHGLAQSLVGHIGVVLRRNHDRGHFLRLPGFIANRNLPFTIRAKIR